MATGPGVNQSKSAFLEQFLASNRDADEDAVNAAWTAAGNAGTINRRLIGTVREKLGPTGKPETSGRATEETSSPATRSKARSSPKGTMGRGTSQVEEALQQSEGHEKGTEPGKTAFVAAMLGREPKANVAAINRAWTAAGNQGSISATVIYTAKRELGGTGEPSPDGTTSAGASQPESSPQGGKADPAVTKPKSPRKASKPDQEGSPVEAASSHASGETASSETTPAVTVSGGGPGPELHEIEGEIDEILFRLKGLGRSAEVLEALRAARRLLVRSHEQ